MCLVKPSLGWDPSMHYAIFLCCLSFIFYDVAVVDEPISLLSVVNFCICTIIFSTTTKWLLITYNLFLWALLLVRCQQSVPGTSRYIIHYTVSSKLGLGISDFDWFIWFDLIFICYNQSWRKIQDTRYEHDELLVRWQICEARQEDRAL